uniref:NDUFB8 n=1 Tax=Euglena gracilis TaxID=3039 RepID=UPI002FE4FAD3|eukprot:EG_transcript_27273
MLATRLRRPAVGLARTTIRMQARTRFMQMEYWEVPMEADHPEYRPVVHDQFLPFVGAPGVHWNPTPYPVGYDLWWNSFEALAMDIHDMGHQESIGESLEKYLLGAGLCFAIFNFLILFDCHFWFSEVNAGHPLYPKQFHYLLRGGDPTDEIWLAQQQREKELMEHGKALVKGEAKA